MSFICLRMFDLPGSAAPDGVGSANGKARRRTEQQHLDFVSLHQAVLFELVFDFLIARLSLLLLGAHATTHLDCGARGRCGWLFWGEAERLMETCAVSSW